MLSELLLSIWPSLYTTKYVGVKSYMSRGGTTIHDSPEGLLNYDAIVRVNYC